MADGGELSECHAHDGEPTASNQEHHEDSAVKAVNASGGQNCYSPHAIIVNPVQVCLCGWESSKSSYYASSLAEE